MLWAVSLRQRAWVFCRPCTMCRWLDKARPRRLQRGLPVALRVKMNNTLLQSLRTAGVRPTAARIGVLQVIELAGSAGISADDVFRQMLERGTHVSTSTVYRIVQNLQSLGLLFCDRRDRHTLYRLRQSLLPPTTEVRLTCRQCGRSVLLPGEELRSELEVRAAEKGLRPFVADLVLQVDCLGYDGSGAAVDRLGCGVPP